MKRAGTGRLGALDDVGVEVDDGVEVAVDLRNRRGDELCELDGCHLARVDEPGEPDRVVVGVLVETHGRILRSPPKPCRRALSFASLATLRE